MCVYPSSIAQSLYEQIILLKQTRTQELTQPETLENISVSSERLNKIQQRIGALDTFPDGLNVPGSP
jgi:hypothetical protein